MVQAAGVEPARVAPSDFKSGASANFATPACSPYFTTGRGGCQFSPAGGSAGTASQTVRRSPRTRKRTSSPQK